MRTLHPDVAVWTSPAPPTQTGSATATIAPAPVQSAVPLETPVELYRVEIRTTAEETLVTVIEIMSPSNKGTGHVDSRKYRRKRQALLRSSVHWLEIDLLRGGERPPLARPVPPAPSYYIVLSRAGRRPAMDVWPIQLADPLPVLPVPLLQPDPDAPLDLGAAVASVYERGPYARSINYRDPPPPPPLSEEEAAWVERLLQDRRTGYPRQQRSTQS